MQARLNTPAFAARTRVAHFTAVLALAGIGTSVAFAGPQAEWPGEEIVPRNKICTLFTGSGEERVQGVSIMNVGLNDGRILVAGETTSTDFITRFGIPSPAPYNQVHTGDTDWYVAILDAAMTTVVAWTYIGGSDDDRAYFAKEDADGDVWVCGFVSSSNFGASGSCVGS